MYSIDPYLRNPSHRITIDVIGVGGTGSFILSRLARLDFALKQMNHPGLYVNAYDPDIVELFNVGRQNFLPSDVGENKAFCMIEKCNFSYGTDWEAYESFHSGEINSNITICCVDNIKFRKLLYDFKSNTKSYNESFIPFFLLDCGNGKDFGQVVLSNVNEKKLKNLYDLFPNADEQDVEEIQQTKGCSYREKLEEQDLFINDLIATEAVQLLKEIFTSKEINYQGVIINQKECKKLPIKI